MFLFAGRCKVSGYLSIFFFVSCANFVVTSTDRPKTMADGRLGGASASPGSDKSDETQGILKSMQTMIGTLVQKVSDMENKYEELRGKAMDEYADSVCEHSMNTAPGRVEEDACSSVPARGRGVDAHTSRADRVGTDNNQSADGCAMGGSKNTHRHTDSISESDFCITVAQNEENDVFSLLEADLDLQEKEGKPVAEKLAKVARSRFSVKLSENKLKEKLDIAT